jgi:hypothetical protein
MCRYEKAHDRWFPSNKPGSLLPQFDPAAECCHRPMHPLLFGYSESIFLLKKRHFPTPIWVVKIHDF